MMYWSYDAIKGSFVIPKHSWTLSAWKKILMISDPEWSNCSSLFITGLMFFSCWSLFRHHNHSNMNYTSISSHNIISILYLNSSLHFYQSFIHYSRHILLHILTFWRGYRLFYHRWFVLCWFYWWFIIYRSCITWFHTNKVGSAKFSDGQWWTGVDFLWAYNSSSSNFITKVTCWEHYYRFIV